MKQISPGEQNIPQCQNHKMDFDFVCLDNSCVEKPDCCIICIKELHSGCLDGLIVEKEYLPQLLEHDSSNKIDEYIQYKKQIYEEFIQTFDQKINKFKEQFEKISNSQNEFQFTNEGIILLKTFFKIKQNSAGEIEFKIDEKNLQKSQDNFTNELQKISKNFTDGIKFLKIENLSDLNPDQFYCHPSIEVHKEGFNSLIFNRKSNSQEYNYFCAVDKKPLKQNTKILITILGIQQSDPYLDIGVIDKTKYQQLIEDANPRISFNTAKSSFCGTSICNIKGTYSGANFVGRKITFQYNKNKNTIQISSTDGQVQLESQDLGQLDLFFYITLYHPVSKCSIRKVLN